MTLYYYISNIRQITNNDATSFSKYSIDSIHLIFFLIYFNFLALLKKSYQKNAIKYLRATLPLIHFWTRYLKSAIKVTLVLKNWT